MVVKQFTPATVHGGFGEVFGFVAK